MTARLLVILSLLWSSVMAPVGVAVQTQANSQDCASCCPLCTPASCPCDLSAPEAPLTPEERHAPISRPSLDQIPGEQPPALAGFNWSAQPQFAAAPEPARARLARTPRASLLCVWIT